MIQLTDGLNVVCIVNRATLPRNVELCMTDVLIQLIEDVNILGQEMTELILEQFDRFDKVRQLGGHIVNCLLIVWLHRDLKIQPIS